MGLLRRRQAPMPSGEDNSSPMYNVTPGTVMTAYAGSFPGMAGSQRQHQESDRQRGAWWTEADPVGIRDDPSYGAVPGDVDTLPYSVGPVNPNDIEDFSLMGNVSKSFRRKAERNPGPVSVLDYRSQLAMQIVQSMTPDVYDEASQLSVIGGF